MNATLLYPTSPRRSWHGIALLLALAAGGAWLLSLQTGARAAGGSPDFVTLARARTVQAIPLHAAPGGGSVLGQVPADVELSIGGSLRYRAGLMPAEALWVLAPIEEGAPRYGFLPADAVLVTAGQPRPLELAGIPIASLLAPGDGQAAVGSAQAELSGADSGVESSGTDEGPLSTAAVAAPAVLAGDLGIAWMPESVTRWSGLLLAAAERHAVDPQLLAIITLVESGGNPGARSSAGALGLMQVMPTTASGIAAARGIDWTGSDALLEPETAIDFGAWYISRQLASFGLGQDPDWQASVERAAAAYNGGPGTLTRHLAGAALPAETSRYQRWVGGMWRERGAADSPTYLAWWDAGGGRMVEAAMAR